jgi:hypothetical protein
MTPRMVRLWLVVLLTTFLAAFVVAVPAMAAPVNAAQTGSHGSAARVSGPTDDMIKPANVTEKICGAGDNTWVHMTMNGQTYCFSGTGKFEFSGNVTGWFCAGNNSGTVYYVNRTGGIVDRGFTPGANENLGGSDVSELYIGGSRGSTTC